jgi:hypothetical protein
MAVISKDEEKFLGNYQDFYKAVQDAEASMDFNVFRIFNDQHSLVGTRMWGGGEEGSIFWRIVKDEKVGLQRNHRVLDILDKLIPFRK